MPKYVVYEVWTKARTIEARSEQEACDKAEPKPRKGMNLCNWHAVEVKEKK